MLDLHLAFSFRKSGASFWACRRQSLTLRDGCCGRGAAALSECAFSVDVSVEVNWQDHAFLETEAGMAKVEEDGTISLVVATQTPFGIGWSWGSPQSDTAKAISWRRI